MKSPGLYKQVQYIHTDLPLHMTATNLSMSSWFTHRIYTKAAKLQLRGRNVFSPGMLNHSTPQLPYTIVNNTEAVCEFQRLEDLKNSNHTHTHTHTHTYIYIQVKPGLPVVATGPPLADKRVATE